MSVKDIGSKLSQARQEKGVSLEDASGVTRIRAHYLEALEKGEFGLLPSPVQVRGFLGAYAAYLNLDPEEIFALLEPSSVPAESPSTPASAPPSPEADSAYREIGAQLRERRTSLELTLPEIEERIHISERYLSWLEAGDFERFPSPTQSRGMLSNYANFLGLPTNELLARYADVLQQQFETVQEEKPSRPKLPGLPKIEFKRPEFELPLWARRILSFDVLFVGGLIVGLFVLFVWGLTRVGATRAEQGSQPTAPALAGLLVPTETATPLTTRAADPGSDLVAVPTQNLTPQLTVEVANPGGIELRIQPNQRVWARISVDGGQVFEGRLAPNETYSYTAISQILIYTGNAGGLRIFLNGRDLGVVGIQGEIAQLLFSPQGLATPTPVPEPTLTPTGEASPTAPSEPSNTTAP
ncbi:MAG: helix-turn-helix domain-containing protein [Chloroflexi bacterium]|nr:DUF4115 domain-containing protein [Chloroflexota bacterium]MQC27173.1 helix-turn-helix domain-containing protein [Chloroflexota bacterium]